MLIRFTKILNLIQNVTIEKAAGVHEFACLQLHTTLMGRDDIIKETTLEIFQYPRQTCMESTCHRFL